jgi:hypothetical protein
MNRKKGLLIFQTLLSWHRVKVSLSMLEGGLGGRFYEQVPFEGNISSDYMYQLIIETERRMKKFENLSELLCATFSIWRACTVRSVEGFDLDM